MIVKSASRSGQLGYQLLGFANRGPRKLSISFAKRYCLGAATHFRA